MKNPVLLRGHTLSRGAMLRPASMSIKLAADALHAVTMVLPPDAPDTAIGDWVAVSTPQGEEIICRITAERTDYAQGGAKTLTLEHVFGTLKDSVTGEKINEDGESISARTAIETLLGKQKETVWALDRCDFSDAMPWSFGNTPIYSALTTITDALEEPQWAMDTGSLPFRVSLIRRPTKPACEMRLNRNISTVQISVDRTGMYTRMYPVGQSELSIAEANGGAAYIEKNVDEYGLIEQTVTNSAIDNAETLLGWGKAQLARNCVPAVTISISGMELSRRTGVPLDKLTVGTVCRVALPEYALTLAQRIISLEWKDAMADEIAVTVTLANEHKTIQGIMKKIQAEVAEVKSGSGGAGSKQQKRNEEMWTNIEQTDARITLEAYRLDHRIDGNTANLAQLNIMADLIQAVVTKNNYSDVGDLLDSYRSEITQTAEQILLRVTYTEYNETKKETSIAIDGINSKITLKADKVSLDALITEVNGLKGGGTQFSSVYTKALIVTNDYMHLGTHDATWESMDVVTSVGGKATGEIAVRDASGNIVGTALTGYRVSYSTSTIYYVGR